MIGVGPDVVYVFDSVSEYGPYESLPSGKLVDPLVRHGTSLNLYDLGPCSNAPKGDVSYEGYPGQFNEIAW